MIKVRHIMFNGQFELFHKTMNVTSMTLSTTGCNKPVQEVERYMNCK